jgi:ATP-binding cassette, subfamily F, member 3
MSVLSASDLSKSFGADDIFSGISLSIPQRARVAIVGPNGIGKTTLLRILAGIEPPSTGQVILARNLKIGYLPQEAGFNATHSLWQECLAAFTDLRYQERELANLESAMADPEQLEAALERYGKLQVDFDQRGGYTYTIRIMQVLNGLGFSRHDYEMPLNHLSGGQRTRALLAKLLLSNTGLLILDEPTNHLDIQAVEWLESYLNQWEGAVLIVSHDRYFLDRVVNTIWEMTRTGFELYRGNYSAYVQQRQERWERRRHIFEAEKERLKKEVDYIKRNIAGQNVIQARGRLRRLSRYLQAVEKLGMESVVGRAWGEVSEDFTPTVSMLSVEEAERRVRALREPNNRPPNFHMKLKPEGRSGNVVLRTQDLEIGFPGKSLFRTEDIELRRLECAAIIGPNGAGKTTMLKTILEEVPPLSGKVDLGASLEIGYFAQAHEGLNPDNRLIDEIEALDPNMLLADIRHYLARFLFVQDEVFKPVSVLSGGERGRLALAKLCMTKANLLLLDEPTNHLDIPSQEILQEVLCDFDGTILLVSHDRYLIDALATQIWDINITEQRMSVFKGTYSEYRMYLEANRQVAGAAADGRASERVSSRKPRASAEEKRRHARMNALEASITELEARLDQLGSQLENPPGDPEKVQEMGYEYVRVQEELDALIKEWEQLHL